MELFFKGGPIMWILALLSVYGLGIILFKIYQIWLSNLFERKYIDATLTEVKQGKLDEALAVLAPIRGPIARIMRTCIEQVKDRSVTQPAKEAEISRVGSGDVRYLEAHLRALEMISNVGPILGLLATEIGMIRAFSSLEKAGTRVDPSMLAGGIWEALIGTVAGLMVAVPALMAYYFFDSIIERTRATMKDVCIQIMALEEQYKRRELEQERARMDDRDRQRLALEEKIRLTEYDRVRQLESKRMEEELKLRGEREKQMEEIERMKRDLESNRTTAQSDTLRLLNPKYSSF